jgi:hypothetical protein
MMSFPISSSSRTLRCAVFLALVLALAPAAHGAQISFCGSSVAAPGQGFVNYSGLESGLAPGYYLMQVHQSGPFTIQNLQAGWNGIAVGAYQSIYGTTTVTLSGIVPASAIPGQTAIATLIVYDVLGQVVASDSIPVLASGSTPAWTEVWQGAPNGGIASYEKLYVGDFDGSGAEEILAVGPGTHNVWITLFKYESGDWQWTWSNYGNPAAGNGIYPYRNSLLVGDFDGDGKSEVLGTAGWITMFRFENGDWQWGWSNYGNPSAGGGIYPYRNELLVGDFDGVQIGGHKRDLVLGISGTWMTMFDFSGGDWHWGWSNYGNPFAGGGIFPYRYGLRVGNFDGTGRDQLLGLAGWATTFSFSSGDWHWGWSNYGQHSLGGWGYPLVASDRLLIGNIDNDARDELVFLQTGQSAAWATTMDFASGHPNWHWSTYGNPPFVGDWPLAGGSADYLLVQAVAGQPKYLIARRRACSGFEMKMYRVTNPAADF